MSEHTTEGLMKLIRRYGDYCVFSEDAADSGATARFNAIRSYATAICQQGELLRQAREFIDTVHDGEYGYSECTRDELVEKIDAALSTSKGKTE